MERIKIQGDANSDKVEFGYAEVRRYNSAEKLKLSLQKLGLFWGIAAVCIFLPVLHFFLVPGFFILGIVMALRARKLETEILKGEIKCPRCENHMVIGAQAVTWPLKEICQGCAFDIRILPV